MIPFLTLFVDPRVGDPRYTVIEADDRKQMVKRIKARLRSPAWRGCVAVWFVPITDLTKGTRFEYPRGV